jgi:hypothetical protein
MLTIESDTTPEATQAQILALRRMGGARRLLSALELSDDARRITEAGIRARHAEYSEAQVRSALHCLLLGEALYRQAYPDGEVLKP